MEESEQSEGIFDIMEENGNFPHLFTKYRNVESFPGREEAVYGRGSTADDAEQDMFLQIRADVDGCVVELRR